MRGWRAGRVAVVALVCGAVVSQVIAYVCRARVTGTHLGSRALPAGELKLPRFLRGVWPEPDEGTSTDGLRAGHTSTTLRCPVAAPPDFRNDPPKYGLYTESFGWPCRSLVVYRACVFTSGGNGGSIDMRRFFAEFAERAGPAAGVSGPSWLPVASMRGASVPVWPLWGGLAVNAVVFGAPVWIGLRVAGVARRRRRVRLGRCAACGYELAGLAVCPECGAASEK